MPVISNRYYNDPNIGAAFQNIAQMFAPPSGSDASGYSQAALLQQQRSMRQQLWANPNDPLADRRGVILNLYDPDHSWAAQDQNNATRKRGQDVMAQTSRLNNADTNRTSIFNTHFGPMSQGQAAPFVPGSIGSQFGVPELPAVAGPAKPLTMTEWDAQQAEAQRASGNLSNDQLLAHVMGNTPTLNVVDAAGRPRVEFAATAAADKDEPYIQKGAEAALKPLMVTTQDGHDQPGVMGQDGVVRNPQTGAKIENVTGWRNLATPAGSNADLNIGPTTANQTEANRLSAGLDATSASLDRYEALLKGNPGVVGVPGALIGAAQNAVQSLKEITQTFGDKAPTAAVTLDDVRHGLEQFAPNYDPAIQLARTNAAELAYQWAQMQNPSGEVSRQAYERALDSISGGFLANNASALAGIKGFRDAIASKRIQVDRLRNPQGAPAAAAVPAPAQAPTVMGKPVQVSTPEEALAFPPGTVFITPDGRTKTRP